MHYFSRAIIAASLVLFACNANALTPNPDAKNKEAELQAVVESFRTAIIEKDKTRFLALFHDLNIPWLAVFEDRSLTQIRQKNPSMPKADPLGSPGPSQFIDYVTKTPERIEEKFNNLRINSNGLVATVYFDYSFHQGDYKSNWGAETWHLVNTDQGWKINSVIFSVELNPEPPAKP